MIEIGLPCTPLSGPVRVQGCTRDEYTHVHPCTRPSSPPSRLLVLYGVAKDSEAQSHTGVRSAGVRSASEARRSPAAVGRKTKCALGIAIPPSTRSAGPPTGAGIALAVARERSASVGRDPPDWRPRRAGSGESNAPSLPCAPLRCGRADDVVRLRSAAAATRGGWVGGRVAGCACDGAAAGTQGRGGAAHRN